MKASIKRKLIKQMISLYRNFWSEEAKKGMTTVYDVFESLIIYMVGMEENQDAIKMWYLIDEIVTPEYFREEFGGLIPPEFLAEFYNKLEEAS